MTVALVSDIHGNRHALQAVLEDVDGRECAEIWCLGDLVGYGAEPDACVDLVREHTSISLCGNHDLAIAGEITTERFSDTALKAAEWTRRTMREDTLAFLARLAPSDESGAVGLYHGSPRDPVWEYLLSPLQAELSFEIQSHRVGIVGHTHVALAFHRLDGESTTGETRHAGDVVDVGAGYWLLNPGSVGQPRDGDPRAAWLELDLDAWTATFHRVHYDIEGAMWEIRAARLPDVLAERLKHGQ